MKIQNFGKPLSRLIIMVAICMLSLHAMAYDFSYTYQGNTLYYNITSDNTVEVTYYSSDNYFQNNNYVSGDVVIPSSVTNNGTTYSVTSIGEWAFEGCSGLTSVTIPNSVISIGEFAFYECSSLTSVTIPNSVTSIGYDAFSGCSGLTSVTIGNGVTSIGSGAFASCSGLTSVTIPNSVTSIGNSAFRNCSGLTSVTIGNSVTSIGDYAFQSCSSLTSVTIPNSVTSIGEFAFSYCSSLTSVTIPNSVTSIADYAFAWCSSLTSIVSNAVVPPALGNEVFPYPNSCNVTIPCGSFEAYTSSQWNNYFPNRIEEDCSSALQEVESTREFVVYPNPARGFAIVEFEALQERSLLRIADLGGRIVKTFDLSAGTESVRLDLRDLPSGVYALMIENTTKKLIVE
ncbi:MAG: leucine-rich repeat protein [Bacteroidales bacterium]|nr:leucine-rich repeat protein [Bacteroidales bacterium]